MKKKNAPTLLDMLTAVAVCQYNTPHIVLDATIRRVLQPIAVIDHTCTLAFLGFVMFNQFKTSLR